MRVAGPCLYSKDFTIILSGQIKCNHYQGNSLINESIIIKRRGGEKERNSGRKKEQKKNKKERKEKKRAKRIKGE